MAHRPSIGIGVLLAVWALAPAGVHAQTIESSLRLDSETGDYIGQGQSAFYAGNGVAFIPSSSGTNTVRLFVNVNNFQHSWNVELSTTPGAGLTPGLYTDARRFGSAEHPGLNVYGDGRGCNMLRGDFEIKQLTFSPYGLTSLWARFEQHCEFQPPALNGEIRYNADVTVAVSAPLNARIERAKLLSFDVAATSATGDHVTLTAHDLPPGASFVDLGNNHGTFSWIPTRDQLGVHTVRFEGVDGSDHHDQSATLI